MNELEFQTGQIKAVECYKEGWEIIKDDFWLLFGISFVGAMIGGLTLYILLGAMMCGIYTCFLQKIDTGKVDFDSLWKGLGFFLPSFIVTLVIVVPTIFVYGMIYVPILFAAILGENLTGNQMMTIFIGGFAIEFVFIILMVCFHTLLFFSFPLIADRRLSALQAMKTSAKAVWKNLGGVASLIGLQFVLVFAGTLLTCGIGLYFMMPILLAGLAVGYRKVFPALGQINVAPPPPNAYQDAGKFQ